MAISVTKGWRLLLAGMVSVVGAGCWVTQSAHTFSRNYGYREGIPVDPPDGCAEDRDVLEGGRLYKLYCGYCHNARPLSERPFSNNEVTLAHMREQAYLTGREHRQILHFMRRWHDLGPPTPDVEPSPKRFFYAEPINELRQETEAAGPRPGDGQADAPPPA